MSLENSKDWLYDQIFRGKIFDTLDSFSGLLKHGPQVKKRKTTRQPEVEVIDTEGYEKEK